MRTHSLVNEEEKLKCTNLASVKQLLASDILEIPKGIMYKEPSKSSPFFVLHLLETKYFSPHRIPQFLPEQGSTQPEKVIFANVLILASIPSHGKNPQFC